MYRFFFLQVGQVGIQLLSHSDHLHNIEQPCIDFYTENLVSLSLSVFFSPNVSFYNMVFPLLIHDLVVQPPVG